MNLASLTEAAPGTPAPYLRFLPAAVPPEAGMLPTDYVAYGLLGLHIIFIACLIVFVISGFDDLFIDIYYLCHVLHRKFIIRRKYPPLPVEKLLEKPEQAIAVMLPAWQEAEVIAASLGTMLETINYRNFAAFVGVYPNDPATRRAAEEVARRHPNVIVVETPNPGPTCKADCLNWIVAGARAYERERNVYFNAFVLHDAEDLVHPLSFKLFNWLLPRIDLIQVPVYSLPRRWRDLVGGHYMDEFAEYHSRELPVRERFGKVVPGAGVGTCYSRRAIELASKGGAADAFSTDSLTEDYEFSLRLRDEDLRQIFVLFPVAKTVIDTRRSKEGDIRYRTISEFICTREYFPNNFRAAVRQKARWTVGIACQGWRKFGWRGDLRLKYLLWRDRKALLVIHFALLGYLVVLGQLALWLYARLTDDPFSYAPLLPEDSRWWILFWITAALFAWRMGQRHYWSVRHYGWRQLPVVGIRFLLANVINYLAVMRALGLWTRHLATGKPIGWDKTAHSFLAADQLQLYKRRIGDLLIDQKLITPEQLRAALERQAQDKRLIGEILVAMGALPESALIDAISLHTGIPAARLTGDQKPDAQVARRLSFEFARKFPVIPVGISPNGEVLLVADRDLPEAARLDIQAALGAPISLYLAPRADIIAALEEYHLESDTIR